MPDANANTGRVVIVTGAGQGLGREHAVAFGKNGYRVVVNDIGDSAEAVAGEVRAAGGAAIARSGDVSDWDYAQALVHKAVAASRATSPRCGSRCATCCTARRGQRTSTAPDARRIRRAPRPPPSPPARG